MLDDYIYPPTCERLRQGIAGIHWDPFTDWLASKGYSKSTIYCYIYAANHFVNWVHETGGTISAITQVNLSDYRAHLAETYHADTINYERGNLYCAAQRFWFYLREHGLASDIHRPTQPLVTSFCTWMRDHRGVAESTLGSYTRTLCRLIEALGNQPQLYTAAQLHSFFLAQSRGYSHGHAESVASAVRMFVRFLIATEQCPSCLRYAIPRIASRSQASLPRYIELTAIESIIAACDPSTPIGARDYAVLLLLAQLALRADDVAGLCLNNIDWARGRLLVSGKSRRTVWLPLPQEAGDAILYYVETGRPLVSTDRLFLLTRAPYTPISAKQVSRIAARAIRRAKVKTESYGAHLFRHSTATALIRQGASLEAIGTLLRHCDIDTTAIYAKVNVELLQQIALPWPKEDTLC